MVAPWLHWLSVVSLAVAVLCALWVLGDILGGHPQKMAVMNIVWPLTPLYFGPFGLWAYYAVGRGSGQEKNSGDGGQDQKNVSMKSAFVGTSHCGAGCTLGDFLGEWAVYLFGWSIAGLALWSAYITDFIMAFLLGVIFQYFSIVPMRGLKPAEGIWAALKADTFSIIAFEVGMFAWMAISRFWIIGHETHPTQPVYWFMMQIAMIVGFFTSLPMNWWLIKAGWKEAM